MADKDPFNFDLSVKSDKKKRKTGRRGMSGAIETSLRVCEAPDCEEQGQYRAPKGPDKLDEFHWFCREHVREFNLKWNFFEGTTEAEMNAQMDRDRVWDRPTKPLKQSAEERAWARLGIEDPHQVLGQNATQNPGRGAGTKGRRLPPTERRAVEILAIKDNATKPEIRKAYKALIKVLHPDMNGGDRSNEDTLQEVVWAWDQLKVSRNFPD